MARLRSNIDRFIPGSPRGKYRGMKFGKTFIEGAKIPLVGAALGPLMAGQSVSEEVVGTLKLGGVVVKSKTANGEVIDLYRYIDPDTSEKRYILDQASFIFEHGEAKVVKLEEDNVRYLELWSGEFMDEMRALQLIQDGALGPHGGVAYNGGQEVIAAQGRPQAIEMPVGLVGMIGDVVVWEVALWRMPYTAQHGAEVLLRSGKNQWLAVATPTETKIISADTESYRRDYDDLVTLKRGRESSVE